MKHIEMSANDIAEFIINPSWPTVPTGNFPAFSEVWKLLVQRADLLIDPKVTEVETTYLFFENGKYRICEYERGFCYSEQIFEKLEDAAQEKARRIYESLDLMRTVDL